MSIQKLLSSPESKTLEFKEAAPSSLSIAKTTCAFANGGGGSIIIGVRDKSREIIGIDELGIPDLEEKISNMIYTLVEPTPAFNAIVYNIEGKLLLKIEIFPGSLKPYHLKNKGELEGTYIRLGSTNRKADLDIIEELRRRRMNIGFDETYVLEASVKDIDVENIKRYLESRKKARDVPVAEPDTAFLKKIKAIKQYNGDVYPTVAGILLFSSEPENYIPGAVVRCARFMGNDMDEFIDQRIITGSLFTQAEETIAFFKKNIRRSAKIEGLYRIEEYEYPEKAIREALVNALCHRDYSRMGADIKFAIFDNRIEITSPGGLLPNITIEDLGTGVSELRNRVIGKIFSESGMIEGYGTGILRIRKYIEERGLVQPEFRDYEGFFKVVFYNTEPDDGEVEKVDGEVEKVDGEVEKVDGEVEKVDGEVEKLTEHQKTILHLIKNNPSISKKEMSETVGIRPSSIDKNIATLKDKQYLRRVGPAKGGHWELIRKLD
ncbi:MAG: ATP-dependent DNA helicase [Candidatus Methanogaster sp.]|uniref:ATP-dependent DNA helicase n=1 Tax=Candidatus Methanogaster sp. TaxID=3386292 RepID=A0AC61KYZ6_9EURY|nr:MAG: ATP-dependent DNA helicase [ANME-2 cluster archaeon]